MGAAFSADGRKIVTVDEFSKAPLVGDWQSGSDVDDLDPWKYLIGQPVVSADGRRIAAGDAYGKVIVWDLQSGRIISELAGAGEGSNVPQVAAVPNSGWFAEGGSDGTVRLWDPDRPESPQRMLGTQSGSPVQALEVSADGANLVSVSENHEVQVWRLSDGMLVQAFQGPPSTNSDVAFNQDGSFVAISAADAAVHIWRVADGQKLAVLQRHGDLINRVQFMRDGSLVTASDDSTVAVFPCPTCGSFPELLKKAQERVQAHQR
jgi:WD40 repeat protein